MSIRIAVAVTESGAIENVAEHFGRCEKFNVCEISDDKSISKKESYFNPLNGDHGGACQLPNYLTQFKIKTIIAGGMGRKAIQSFNNSGIDVITAPGLEYNKALALFIEGKLSGYSECKHEDEHQGCQHHHGQSHN
jgi:predicted Fe-Mo cluster-binding NifX family protein